MTDAGAAAASQDPRPRPQFGEYATPEEQRAHIREPAATWVYEAPATDAPQPTPVVAPAAPAATDAQPGVPAQPRSRAIDRIVTFALLAYGLITVISAFPQLVDFVAYADTMFEVIGVEATLSDPAAGRPWGIAAALVLAFGWVLTALLSWVNMRRGRVSWWIPLVGGAVFTLASAMLVLVPLMNDPAVWDALVGSIR